MGVVYRALDLKLERTVALKFLPNELVASQTEKDRFLREARTASSLDHPNIGAIHGIEETDDGRSFIVMSFYEGATLSGKISRGPLPLGEAVDIAIQMARGLAEAHARAVIHRDIKPSNVIITQQNIAKIVDFGLARVTTPSVTTQSIGTTGTIGYMSPEQTMGQLLDQRTDIWSLGVVLAEMVTGRHPFQRESAPATIVAILNELPKLTDEVPLELQRIVYRALSKLPGNAGGPGDLPRSIGPKLDCVSGRHPSHPSRLRRRIQATVRARFQPHVAPSRRCKTEVALVACRFRHRGHSSGSSVLCPASPRSSYEPVRSP